MVLTGKWGLGFSGRGAKFEKYRETTGVGNSKQQSKGSWGKICRNFAEKIKEYLDQ